MLLVRKNAEFARLHFYYITRRLNLLKKMRSLMVIACKLICVFYAIWIKGVDYSSRKMNGDIERPTVYLQAA